MRAYLIAIALLGMFPVCSYGESAYPSTWPKPMKDPTGRCVSLSGKYQYRGDVDRRDREGLPTIDRAAFNRMSVRGYPRSATFEHDVTGGLVSVTIHGDNINPSERATFTRTLMCEDGWSVNLRQIGNCANLTVPPFDCSRVRLLYTRGEDRSLIVHFTTLAVSKKVFSEPTTSIVDAWYRFEMEAE